MGYLRRKIKGYTTAIGIFSLIAIVTSSGITTISINYFDINPIRFAYGQANQMSSNSNSNNTNTNSPRCIRYTSKESSCWRHRYCIQSLW